MAQMIIAIMQLLCDIGTMTESCGTLFFVVVVFQKTTKSAVLQGLGLGPLLFQISELKNSSMESFAKIIVKDSCRNFDNTLIDFECESLMELSTELSDAWLQRMRTEVHDFNNYFNV